MWRAHGGREEREKDVMVCDACWSKTFNGRLMGLVMLKEKKIMYIVAGMLQFTKVYK